MLHVSQRSYSYYERGENDIPTEALCKLADLYGTSTDYPLGRTDEIKPTRRGREHSDILYKARTIPVRNSGGMGLFCVRYPWEVNGGQDGCCPAGRKFRRRCRKAVEGWSVRCSDR